MKIRLHILLAITVSLIACTNDKGNTGESVPDSTTTKKIDSSRLVLKFSNTALEAKITDTLMKISFVKETDRYIDSLTGHKHGISFIMDSVGKNEISVMAGYNGPERFETYYNFTVYPGTFDISIEYPDTGELIPIAQYIKLTKE